MSSEKKHPYYLDPEGFIGKMDRGDDTRTVFYEIPPPVDARKLQLKKVLKVSGLVAICVIAAIIVIPLALRPVYTVADSSIEIYSLKASGTDENGNPVFALTFKLHNPSPVEFTVTNYSLDIFSVNGSEKIPIAEGTFARESFKINANAYKSISVYFILSNSSPNAADFIRSILMKDNISIYIGGTIATDLEDPKFLKVSAEKTAAELFGYEVDDTAHIILNNDIISVEKPSPDITDIAFVFRYDNPFDSGLTITYTKFTLVNDSEIWGTYESSVRKSIGAANYTNFTLVTNPKSDQITAVLSALLGGETRVFGLVNISFGFEIWNFNISGFRAFEYVKSTYKVSLKIVGFSMVGGLTLDIEFHNGCGVRFNLTYIYVDIFLAGSHRTQKAIWLHDKVSMPPLDYVPVYEYSDTVVYDIPVQYDSAYVFEILYNNHPVDLLGYITVRSFTYYDDIPFVSENQTIMG